MKRTILFLLALVVMVPGLIAQNSNAIFFTEDGESFYVIMNGLRENDTPMTNIKVTGLKAKPYVVKIIFADENLGTLDKKVYLQENVESTFVIKKKKQSKLSKDTKGYTNEMMDNIGLNKKIKSADKESWYVMRLMAQNDINQPAAAQQTPQRPVNQNNRTNANVQQSSGVSSNQVQTSTNVQSSSTTTSQSVSVVSHNNATHHDNADISLNVNIGAGGTGVSTGSSTYYEETTTTTTVTNTGTAAPAQSQPAADHYVMPGYNGPIGCPWPMSEADFAGAKNSISSKSFEDSKMTMARQITKANCLFAGQVKEVMLLFDFEDTRLEFAKFAYGKTYDIGNYYKVNDAFDFESSIEELNEYIQGR